MSKFGFIYIWYDRKHKRFYIGQHWGTEDDGYVCSSNWMRDAHKRRPQDFKRRIISRIYTNRSDLAKEEYRWLQMIKENEVGERYYNLHKGRTNQWWTNEQSSKTVSEKLSISLKKKHAEDPEWSYRTCANRKGTKPYTNGTIERAFRKGDIIPEGFHYGRLPWTTGHPSNETIEKIRQSNLGQKRSEETKQKITLSVRGRKQTEETKKKRADSLRGQQRSKTTKSLLSIKAKERQKVECPYCHKTGAISQMKRWHFTNCRLPMH